MNFLWNFASGKVRKSLSLSNLEVKGESSCSIFGKDVLC